MASSLGTDLPRQGKSLKNPPFFDGTEYICWKATMKVFVQSINYDLWDSITIGPYVPEKIVNGKKVEKTPQEWNKDDTKSIEIDAEAMHILYCGLDKKILAMVLTCKSAREIWDRIEVIYEGTGQVKELKFRNLEREYDFFEMDPKESILDMFARFRHITNALHFLGRTYTDHQVVQKILRTLPESWEPKVTAIKMTPNFVRLSPDELLGLLLEYAKRRPGDEDKNDAEICGKRIRKFL